MHKYFYAAFAQLLMLSSAAVAQTPTTFVGIWKVTWTAKRPQEARLVIAESGGTWKTAARDRNDPCVGLEAPIEVLRISDEEIAILLKFSEAISGCNNARITLRRKDEKILTGLRGSAELTAVRE